MSESEFDRSVREYLEGDRQWPRLCRITYAQERLNASTNDKPFWEAILKALND